ncbi:hypothetical protein ACFL2V_21920 [Pseudomonadota bacterium]
MALQKEHVHDRKLLFDNLDLPEHIQPVAVIPVGYPDESEIVPEKEFRDIKEMIHLDGW